MEKQDDGSLAFLKIPPDANNKSWKIDEVKQSRLVNTTFWVLDFMENMRTKHGEGRFLVRIADHPDDPPSKHRKFFTNTPDIKYVLQKIREYDAFPRRVTMRGEGNHYHFE